MPFQSTGSVSPDLSTYTGYHQGFGVPGGGTGEGFDFGALLKSRWAMQKKMMQAQLDNMRYQQQMQEHQANQQARGLVEAMRVQRQARGDVQQGKAEAKAGAMAQAQMLARNALGPGTAQAMGARPGEIGQLGAVANWLGPQLTQAGLMQSGGLYGTRSATGGLTADQILAQTQQEGEGTPELREGGYIPKDMKVKVHRGEVVLSPEQSKAMFPGLGPGPNRKSYQGGSMTIQDLIAEIRKLQGQGVGQPGMGNPLLPAPLGPGGPGTTPGLPDFPSPLGPEPQGLLGSGERSLVPSRPPGGPAGPRLVGAGKTPGIAGKATSTIGEGLGKIAGLKKAVEKTAKVAAKGGKVGKMGALGMAGAAGVAGLALSPEESESKVWNSIKGWLAKTPVGLALAYSPAALAVEYGFDESLSEILIGWAKELGKRHPLGVLMSEAMGEGEDEEAAPIKPLPLGEEARGFEVTREEGKAPKFSGESSYSEAQKFADHLTQLKRQQTEAKHWGGMAQSRADKLEIQINKRPFADNKGLLKMMKSRQQEAKRFKQTEEKTGGEYSAVRIKQQEMNTELAKQHQLNKTKQLDTAFDALDAYWKQAVKVDDGDERFVQYGMGMLLPYVGRFQQMGEYGTPEEAVEGMRQMLANAYEKGPSEYQWIKLMLQQGG